MWHGALPKQLRRPLASFLRTMTTSSVSVSIFPQTRKMDAAERLAPAADAFSHFQHSDDGGKPCEACVHELAQMATAVENELPTASIFISAIIESRFCSSVSGERDLAHCISVLLRSAVSVCRAYRARFDSKQSVSARSYSNLYETPNSDGISVDYGVAKSTAEKERDVCGLLAVSSSDAARTGELFPGRRLCRPRVRFTNGSGNDSWSEECSKDYRHGANQCPGLFTLQCACAHPKLLGVSVMLSSESVATALSALLSRFPVLPSVSFYDNACNLARSTALRFPWVSENTSILCDRFHYRTHRCGPEFEPDSFSSCYSLLTSGAESLNRQWAASRNNIRFLAGKINTVSVRKFSVY